MSNEQSKSAILSAVRQALETHPHVVDPGRPFSLPIARITGAPQPLVERFSEEIAKLGSKCYLAPSAEDANKYIVELIQKREISRVAISNSQLLSDIGVATALQNIGTTPQIVDYG